MSGKVKSKPSPDETYQLSVLWAHEGRKQSEVLAELGITKPTLKDHLLKKGTSWGDLKKVKSKSKGKGSKPGKSKVRPTPKKGPPEDSILIDEAAVPEEIKEIASIMRYFKSQDLGVRFTEILAWKDKTNQLEDKSNDTDIAKVQQDEFGKIRDRCFV